MRLQVSTKRAWITLTAIVLGVMLVVQFRSSAGGFNERQYMYLENRLDYYVSQSAKLKIMDEKQAALRQKVFQAGKSEADPALQGRLKRDELVSGLTPMEGPGIQIQLEDSIAQLPPGEDVANYLLHEEDLLGVVADLVEAGAEVIAINDQRLVATSEIRCAGPTVSVNKRRLSPPYRIYAIGNPDSLVRGVLKPNGRIQLLRLWKIRYQVRTNRQLHHLIEIPKYQGNMLNLIAKPLGEEGSR